MSLRPKKVKRKSLFLRAFGSLNKRFYRLVEKGIFGRYFSGYDASCERLNRSVLGRLFSKWKRKASGVHEAPIAEELPLEAEGIVTYEESTIRYGVRDKFAQKFDQSKLVCAARKFKGILLNTPLVNYGLILFGFALLLLISQAVNLFFELFNVPLGVFTYALSSDTVLTVSYMAAAVVLMALSLIWVFVPNGSLVSFMLDSILIGSLLKNTMGITQMHQKSSKPAVIPRRSAFFVGALLGILTFFVTPHWFFVGLLIAVLVMIVVNIPEFGIVFGIFILPYLSLFQHPTIMAVSLILLLIFSTVLKLLRGKRTYRFEPLDIYVALFLLLMFLGGVITTGGVSSFFRAVTILVFGMSYFVLKVLVRDEAWLKRCIGALVASSVPVSALAIAEFVLGKAGTNWQDTAVFSSLTGRATSLWGNPNVLAEFLLIAFFAALGSLLAQKSVKKRLSMTIALLLNGAALIFTWSRGAWVAVVVALIAVMLMYSHKSLPFILAGVMVFAAALVFLPESFVTRVQSIVTFSDSSTLYRINIWRGSAALIRDVFWSGVGVGEEAFRAAYLPYALSGIENAPHAHNLVMQILIELGVVGLLVFIIMLVSVARVVFTLFAKCRMKHSVSLLALGVYGAFLALLFHGATDYIWYNLRVYLLFFILIGLLSAARQIGNQTLYTNVSEEDCCDVDIVLCR